MPVLRYAARARRWMCRVIRITLEKDEWVDDRGRVMMPARTQVMEFEDHARADNWLVEDSYYAEPYTRKMTWERIP